MRRSICRLFDYRLRRHETTAARIRILPHPKQRKKNMDTIFAATVLRRIEDNPQRHNQNWWVLDDSSGAVMCVAGWACHISGDMFITDEDGESCSRVRDRDGIEWGIEVRAAHLFGINLGTSAALFHVADNAHALRRLRAIVSGNQSWWMVA